MPFVLDVRSASPSGAELHLSGRISSGAFFGPENAIVHSRDGRALTTRILGHAFEHPQGWPIVPEHHKTVLTVTIPAVQADFVVARLEGVGAVAKNGSRTDVSNFLAVPEFWACELILHGATEDVEDPGETWLGVSSEASDAWYIRNIQSPLDAGSALFIRKELPDARYIELEMVAGPEYQDRVWVGDAMHRALLGYHSGHFSLPALRAEEIRYIARLTNRDVSNLLWLSTVYLHDTSDKSLRDLTEDLLSRIPTCRADTCSQIAEPYLENRVVEGIEWTKDPRRGWTNNWQYSQRNPASRLSILNDEDFEFVREFFAAADE